MVLQQLSWLDWVITTNLAKSNNQNYHYVIFLSYITSRDMLIKAELTKCNFSSQFLVINKITVFLCTTFCSISLLGMLLITFWHVSLSRFLIKTKLLSNNLYSLQLVWDHQSWLLILFYFSYRFLQDPRILSVLKQLQFLMKLLPQKRLLKTFSNDPTDLYHVIRFIILTELMLHKFLGKREHLERNIMTNLWLTPC